MPSRKENNNLVTPISYYAKLCIFVFFFFTLKIKQYRIKAILYCLTLGIGQAASENKLKIIFCLGNDLSEKNIVKLENIEK